MSAARAQLDELGTPPCTCRQCVVNREDAARRVRERDVESACPRCEGTGRWYSISGPNRQVHWHLCALCRPERQ